MFCHRCYAMSLANCNSVSWKSTPSKNCSFGKVPVVYYPSKVGADLVCFQIYLSLTILILDHF